MMLVSDMILAWDPAFRTHLEQYAAKQAQLKEDFGAEFKKLTELGCGF
jgi:catalase (peroxidase I)